MKSNTCSNWIKLIPVLFVCFTVFFLSYPAFPAGNVSVVYEDGNEKTFGFVKNVVEVYDDFGRLQQIRIIPVQPNTETVINYDGIRSYNVTPSVKVDRLRQNYNTDYGRQYDMKPGGYNGFWSEKEYQNWKDNIIKESR